MLANCSSNYNTFSIASIDYNYIDTGIEVRLCCIIYGNILGDRTDTFADNSTFAVVLLPLLGLATTEEACAPFLKSMLITLINQLYYFILLYIPIHQLILTIN